MSQTFEIGVVKFKGISGEDFNLAVYPISLTFDSIGAVYIITRRFKNTHGKIKHKAIYVGETNDLSTRFTNHHKEKCFLKHQANCICTLYESNENTRLEIEKNLKIKYKPICND